MRRNSSCEDSDAQGPQRSPASVQGQAGWCSEPPDPRVGPLGHGRGWNQAIFRIPSNPGHSMALPQNHERQSLLPEGSWGCFKPWLKQVWWWVAKKLQLWLWLLSAFPESCPVSKDRQTGWGEEEETLIRLSLLEMPAESLTIQLLCCTLQPQKNPQPFSLTAC